MSSETTLAVDVGGTFTDAVVSAPHGLFTGKTPTTTHDQSIGAIEAARIAIGAADLEPRQIDSFVHGMTVTTNAALEGNFARTALFATTGFTDIEQIGRQNRADLYRLCASRPSPIVPEHLRFAIDERCGPDGVVQALDESSLITACRQCADAAVEAIAICLLFSFRHSRHELRARELIEHELPGVHVSLSHEVVGTFREYERCATTIIDAALSPLLANYLGRLAERAGEFGLPEPDVMLSNGGTIAAAIAARNAASTVLSGPAGGAIATKLVAGRAGRAHAIGFDMGGTSTDVCTVTDHSVGMTAYHEIDGRPIALPTLDIGTVGAGGGSIAWCDDGGALRVGPRSAGANPGPACYGHGGAQPTVTDANLLLGHIADESALAGGLSLRRGPAESAITGLAEQLGLGLIETAAGIVEVAILEMQRQVAAKTVARGIDPREFTLVAFGGAGPMHAAAIAEALKIKRVACPSASGVLSAYGIAAAGRRSDHSLSVVEPLSTVSADRAASIVDALARRSADDLGRDLSQLHQTVVYELRYSGQSFELPVAAEFERLAEEFHRIHEERFGFHSDDAAIDLVTVRVSVAAPGVEPSAVIEQREESQREREMWVDGSWQVATVFSAVPTLGDRVDGPAVFELAESTVVVPPGWQAESQAGGDLALTHQKDSETDD